MDVALTALVGFAGIIAGGLLQMRHARIEQLRERRLEAADDFASAASVVFVTLTREMETLGTPDPAHPDAWLQGFEKAVEDTRKSLHELTPRLPRLELLFGVGSPTASAAAEMTGHLHRMNQEIVKHPADSELVVKEYDAAVDAFGEFNRCGNEALTVPEWQRLMKRRSRSSGGTPASPP